MGHCSNLRLILDRTHPICAVSVTTVQVQQSYRYSSRGHASADCDYLASYTAFILNTIQINTIGQMNKPKAQNNEIIHPESTQKQSYTFDSKPYQLQCPNHYCCCLHCGCPPFGLMAWPQLWPCSLSSWVKSVVAPSGLTRHKTGDESCNREIRVVFGVLLFPCTQCQLANLPSFTTIIPVL